MLLLLLLLLLPLCHNHCRLIILRKQLRQIAPLWSSSPVACMCVWKQQQADALMRSDFVRDGIQSYGVAPGFRRRHYVYTLNINKNQLSDIF